MDKMTGSEFRDYVVRVFKRTDKDTEIYEATTDTLINMRVRFPFDQLSYEAYATGISQLGQYKLDMPTDFGHIIGDVRLLDGDDSWVLRKLTKGAFDRMFPNPNYADADRDRPEYYCIFGTQLLLGHVPDKITYQYELNYSTEPAEEILAGTTAVLFTDVYREILRYGVLARLFSQIGNDAEAQKWILMYEQEIVKIIAQDMRNVDAPTMTMYRGI